MNRMDNVDPSRAWRYAARSLALAACMSCGSRAPATDQGVATQELTPKGWRNLGPFGVDQGSGIKWTGTTTDVENPSGTGIYRISTLDNGLFEWNGSAWVSLTSGITPVNNPPSDTEALGANTFASRPGDTNTIVFGTMTERTHGAGFSATAGIWRGSNGPNGWSWSQVVTPGQAGEVYRIRWSDFM